MEGFVRSPGLVDELEYGARTLSVMMIFSASVVDFPGVYVYGLLRLSVGLLALLRWSGAGATSSGLGELKEVA